jgi:hypothetical protein
MAPTDHDNIPYTVNYELLSVLLLDRVKKMETSLSNALQRIDILEQR